MSTPGYMQWVLSGKKESSKSKKRKTAPSDTSRPFQTVLHPVQTVLPTAGGSSSVPVVAPSSPMVASMKNAVTMEPEELWEKGATSSLLAAIRLLKEFGLGVPLSVGDTAVLNEIRESGLKLASLVETFKNLSVRYGKASSSNSNLAALADKAKKEKEGLSSKVQELETKVSELTSSLKVSKAEVDQASKKAKEREDEVREKDAKLKGKDDKISELEKKVADLLVVLRKAVSESFDNAVSQARILNPGLVTEGMDFANIVKNGEIIQCVPEVNEGDKEEEDDEEETEVAEVETPETTPKAPTVKTSEVRDGEGSAAQGE